jgi:hypothetical protein
MHFRPAPVPSCIPRRWRFPPPHCPLTRTLPLGSGDSGGSFAAPHWRDPLVHTGWRKGDAYVKTARLRTANPMVRLLRTARGEGTLGSARRSILAAAIYLWSLYRVFPCQLPQAPALAPPSAPRPAQASACSRHLTPAPAPCVPIPPPPLTRRFGIRWLPLTREREEEAKNRTGMLQSLGRVTTAPHCCSH